jgi:1,5-anhydro-D-fructose reductase (1,5-anhydro-D-mannitol-forming)
MNKIRWGSIGCGDVCEVKSAPGLQKATGSDLVAVMRRDAAKAADFATRHGVPRSYSDAEALVGDPEVDAVYVATPPSTHLMYAQMAARAGKPVYVEKPMAPTTAECEQMIAACAAARVPLFVAYYRRALPRFVRIKTLLDEGRLGDVQAVTITLVRPPEAAHLDGKNLPWRVQPEIAGAGLFLDLASHTLDLLDHLLGPIAKVQGHASNRGGHYRAEDTVSGQLQFASGAHGVGLWCFVSGERTDRVELIGSRGRLTFSTFENDPVLLETAAGREEIQIPHPPHVQQPLIQLMVDELLGKPGPGCPSTGVTAARTTAVMDTLLASYRERGKKG